MNFKIIDLEQGTDNWRDFRDLHIGASECGTILGLNKYKTPYHQWKEKLGIVPKQFCNEAMQRGISLEPSARSKFEEESGILMPSMVIQSIEHEFMIASLDGINIDEKCIIEIKCPGIKTYQMAVEGKIPAVYTAQIQHQLSVSGFDLCYYYCFDGEDGVTIKVTRDQEMIDWIIEKEKEFYNSMVELEPLMEWMK